MAPRAVRPTRGSGLLESFLARQRARRADRLIPDDLRSGKILDLGCGSRPYFLRSVRFAEKWGVDRLVGADATDAADGLHLVGHDVGEQAPLPFEADSFSVVTMLAVFEHLDPSTLRRLLREITRVLRPGGVFVMTTPAVWTEPVLRVMARLNLVSPEEIEEHFDQYDCSRIEELLREAGFDQVETGTFELGMNLWARAARTPPG